MLTFTLSYYTKINLYTFPYHILSARNANIGQRAESQHRWRAYIGCDMEKKRNYDIYYNHTYLLKNLFLSV